MPLSSSHRRAAMHDLPAGTPLGKYEIVRKIATGGMAEIYLARVRGNAGFEKLCVLKRILPTIADDTSFVQMFLDEARLAATLHHPNIADVYDVGEDDGDLFFAMEYIHGQDLRSLKLRARERRELVSLPVALAVIHGAASALGYAHDRTGSDGKQLGLVHRDVSASNVMVSYDGAIKLLDFGIARAQSHTHKTQTGTLKGKVPYMSPEQCRGFPLDRRSDLFSLGVVLYEITVGRRPFRGEGDFAIMDQIVNHGAPAPGTLISGYPPELEAIVMRLLERKPEARYQTADAMIADLEAFQAQHRLWVSSNALGKYMRTVFAERVQAWESAQQEGVSLLQHVAQTITSQTPKSELITPPSAFPGLVPLSQEMPAVAAPLLPPVPASVTASHVTAGEPESQVVSVRASRKNLWFALAAVLAVSLGAVAAFMLGRANQPGDAREAPTVRMQAARPDDHPAATPGSAALADTHEVAPPAVAPPAAAPPPVEAPAVDVPAPDPQPVTPAPAPTPPATRPAPTPPTPVTRKPPVTRPVTRPRPNPPPPTPKDPKPKDHGWDPNSPFLPH